MKIVHAHIDETLEAVIELIHEEDWEVIEKSDQFNFNWKLEKDHLVHKIKLKLEEEILGLIAIQDYPNELRLHIKLLENAKHSRGKDKTYKRVAGCLIAHTCQMAFEKNYEGFVSLHPKTALKSHYENYYGFKEMGIFIYTELENSEKLIKKYLNDGE